MSEYQFTDKGCQVFVRFRKSAWYLTYYNPEDSSSHLLVFPLKPDVKPLVEFFHRQEVEGLLGLLMRIPHEEL